MTLMPLEGRARKHGMKMENTRRWVRRRCCRFAAVGGLAALLTTATDAATARGSRTLHP